MFWFFDFDGTLVDTERDIVLAWKATIAKLGLSCPHFDEVYRTGPSINEITKRLFPDHPDIDALIAAVRANFAVLYDSSGFPNTKPYPGVEAWLAKLKARGDKVFIATNKRCRALEIIIHNLSWPERGLIDGWYTSDKDPANIRRKPVFLADALKELGAAPADCTMVGDTKDDIEAGRANSMRTIAVTWGYGEAADLLLADERISAPPV